ncbi:MAG: Mur ligase family protein, partial [Gemmatimonadota bacterium]
MDSAAAGTRSLAMLLESVPDARAPSAAPIADVCVRGVNTDARRVRHGDLYIAIAGVQADGHTFAAEAARRGAAAIVAERSIPFAGPPVIVVDSSRRALAAIAAAWFGRPADRLRLVGITGSLGKTSILMMLSSILDGADGRVGIVGSLGARLGERGERTRLTTPDAWDLHRILRWMADAGAERVIMEATSHALEQERLHGLAYELGVFTNLVPLEHGEYHGSFRGYVETKRGFLDRLEPHAPIVYGAG